MNIPRGRRWDSLLVGKERRSAERLDRQRHELTPGYMDVFIKSKTRTSALHHFTFCISEFTSSVIYLPSAQY